MNSVAPNPLTKSSCADLFGNVQLKIVKPLPVLDDRRYLNFGHKHDEAEYISVFELNLQF